MKDRVYCSGNNLGQESSTIARYDGQRMRSLSWKHVILETEECSGVLFYIEFLLII
jgi:hypothetical protein